MIDKLNKVYLVMTSWYEYNNDVKIVSFVELNKIIMDLSKLGYF